MERVAEFTGKKVADAVEEGLKALGLSLDDVDIKIISNGGLLKKAKVEIHYDDGLTEEQVAAAQAALAKEKEAKAAQATEDKEEPAKKSDAPEGEPHWGSAPVKREPTTKPDYGKATGESKPAGESKKKKAAAQEDAASEGSEQAPKPHKENRKEHAKDNHKEGHKENHKKNRESVLPTEVQIATAKEFLDELLAHMKIEGKAEITVDEGMRINVDTEDARVIGHRGEVLDAIQQLVSSLINTSHGSFVHVTVDGLGYRDRRKDSLENLARRMADKAVRSHRKVTLDAMNSADRRIIHAALGEREDVFTRSEGHEPQRRVAIIPKRK